MKPLFAWLFCLLATAAFAHPSVVPHEHPHGPSLLPDLDTFVALVALCGVALIVLGRFKKR